MPKITSFTLMWQQQKKNIKTTAILPKLGQKGSNVNWEKMLATIKEEFI